VQEASLPAAGLEEFFSRLELKQGEKPSESANVPRWAWSNPAWKSACLKGIADASGNFQRTPSLTLSGLPERLSRSIQKILSSLGFKPEAGPDGTIVIKGAEDIRRYFETVGTSNMKLKDQFKAFARGPRPDRSPAEEQRRPPASEEASEPAPELAEQETEPLAEPLESADLSTEQEPLDAAKEPDPEIAQDEPEPSDAPQEEPAAPAEQPPSGSEKSDAPRPRRRRTLYRGRPN